jgi:YHS domain-containing protein
MRSFHRMAVCAMLTAWAAPAAYAGDFFETDGVAIGGYDPVAYFKQHSAVPGLVSVTATYQGSRFRFASTADRDLFAANPAKYAPQYHGFCTFAVAEGAKAPSNPAAFRVIGGKLYLQYSDAVTRRFDQSPAKYLQAAETNWPTVQNKPLEK